VQVTNFGNPFGLNDLPWYFSGSVALQGVVGAIVQVRYSDRCPRRSSSSSLGVQAFFSYRVQVVSGVWWLAVPAYFAQIFRGSLAIAITAITVKENELTVFRANHTYLVFMTLIASVVVRRCALSRRLRHLWVEDGCMEHGASVLLSS
jgi:hypothetical protein